MKKPASRSCGLGLAILALTLLAAPAFSQVPQDMTFTGRLVDNLGAPLAGPVNLGLRVFDAETGGTKLYQEQHLGVPIDATGGFSVQLGLGTSPQGTFDADLFSDVNRYLEVTVGPEVLTPRQIMGSVPWALIAQQANEIVLDPNAPRFEDCGDGTVADHQTGLQWEKKTGTLGGADLCAPPPCPDPHVVNSLYSWSTGGTGPNGGAFTDFLARINGDPGTTAATTPEALGDPAADPTVCLAHHCDWHLPAIGELRTILIGPGAAPGQATMCGGAPCIDPGFAAVGGPTGTADIYWSASTSANNQSLAWIADPGNGTVYDDPNGKASFHYVRAVRAGSCN